MMGIVVDDPDTVHAALRLEAALGTVERSEARCHLLEAHADREARDDAGHRVEDIVAARDVEVDVAERLLAVEDVERDTRAAVRDVLRAVVGLMVDGVRDVLAVEVLGHITQVLVVEADDGVARLLVDVLDELRERLDDVLHRAVVVHVVVFDIRHNGDVRVELEERTVALIGLRHEVVARAELCIRAEVRDLTADDDRRRDAGMRQGDAEHRSRRRLAVRAGDRDALVLIDECRIDVRAVQLRDAEVLGRQDFRIVERDGSRDDDGIHAADVLRLLAAQRDLCAHLAQFLDDAGILAV